MMQIHRLFATLVILGSAISVSFDARGEAMRLHVTVDPGASARTNAPVVATLTAGKELTADQAMQIAAPPSLVLAGQGSEDRIVAQVESAKAADGAAQVILRWVEPKLEANKRIEYVLPLNEGRKTQKFRFASGDGYRDLFYDKQPIARYMTPRYDPADAPTTYKPYLQVYGLHDDGFITKGPGGLDMHHRGIFFGFHTQYGDFWHCQDGESQQHDRYLADREFAGPVAARESSATNWITKDGKIVARDTREVTAWRTAADEVLFDFDITLESLAGDLELGPDAHHGGFHFRASQEVAGSETKRDQGKCTFVRPATAKLARDDIWSDTPWAAMMFPIQGHPYVVMLMDHPDNPQPTQFSLRGYGRFGAYFKTTLPQDKPLHLRYRVLVLDGKANPNPTAEQLATRYQDFVAPPTVSVISK